MPEEFRRTARSSPSDCAALAERAIALAVQLPEGCWLRDQLERRASQVRRYLTADLGPLAALVRQAEEALE
jgi:hypothetical protein